MSSSLVDFHCHLDLYPDHEAIFDERELSRIFTLAVTTTPRAWPRNRDLAAGKKYIRAALGLHPQLIADQVDEYPIWESFLHEARFVGEIGLDASPKYYHSFKQQKNTFGQILQACAEQGNKVLSVHSVRSATPVLDLIEKHFPASRGIVVLHWFTGTRAEADRAVEMGCYFSINLEMLQRPIHRKTIAALPQNRILTESDGPFITFGPSNNYQDGLIQTISMLAEVRDTDTEETARDVLSNIQSLLG